MIKGPESLYSILVKRDSAATVLEQREIVLVQGWVESATRWELPEGR